MRCHVLGFQQESLALAVQVGADDGEAAQGNAGQVVGHKAKEFGVGAGHARMHAALGLHTRAKGCRRALKLLVGDQTLDQDLAQGVAVERTELLELIVILVIVMLATGSFYIVPQQKSFIIERLGKYKGYETAGFHVKVPFIDRIAARMSLRIEQLD